MPPAPLGGAGEEAAGAGRDRALAGGRRLVAARRRYPPALLQGAPGRCWRGRRGGGGPRLRPLGPQSRVLVPGAGTRLTRSGRPRGGSRLGFAHLHVRSGFSYGLGTATPKELVEASSRMGYGALAITDRDGLYGVPRFLRASGEHGLSPMVGVEVGVRLEERGHGEAEHRGHVVLLAASDRGYRSLSRLLTGYLLPRKGAPWPSAAERRNPSCGLGALLEHVGSAGGELVCLTGAVPFGLVPSLVLSRDPALRARAAEVLSGLAEAFGRGNVYVELSDDGTEGSRRRMRVVEHLAARCGLPTVAAGEVTYLGPRDHRLSEALAAARALSPSRRPATGPRTGFICVPPRRWRACSPTGPRPSGTPWRSRRGARGRWVSSAASAAASWSRAPVSLGGAPRRTALWPAWRSPARGGCTLRRSGGGRMRFPPRPR
ncbi:PHP domain-containing protein (plasmid) [Rubrobacter marinus]|uniref:PHP domain-containing protein n=1 Tax=Rubrobacter marinus TaxID=2653852 RepID=A0A6G8Q3Q2_9ACTN|nr:PHP domain-containing protein [Rubrobacter marinus]